ncbi:MAG TPA: ABC transporter substrate-binding protein, partial [Anaerolineaceae bacterium]|nr:ABC transporter substrate-binding protein [Anaerolineaceae bacterium]
MKRNSLFLVVSVIIVASMILAACTTVAPTTVATTEAPVVTEAPTEVATEAPTPEPTEEPRTTRKGGWFDSIVISVVDNAAAVTQIKAGAIDIYADGVSSDTLPEIQAAGLGYSSANGLYYELTFNPVGPVFESTGKVNPFHFAEAREAMNWLIDRDYLNREIYSGG